MTVKQRGPRLTQRGREIFYTCMDCEFFRVEPRSRGLWHDYLCDAEDITYIGNVLTPDSCPFIRDETPCSRDMLIAAIKQGFQPQYLFFWGTRARREGAEKRCLSQWWPVNFTIGGVTYPSAEHFMMAEKARLFGDQETWAKILRVEHPREAKRLGRQVKGFDERDWQHCRFAIVVRGNLAKFSQNAALGEVLLGTGNRVLVESSPTDYVWGIGLAEEDPRAADPKQWRGINSLGFALMEVRRKLRAE